YVGNPDNPIIGIPGNDVPADTDLDAAIGQGGAAQAALRVPLDVNQRLRKRLPPDFPVRINARRGRSQHALAERLFPASPRDAYRKDALLVGFLAPVAPLHEPEE